MVPLRQAVMLGLLLALVSLEVSFHRAGYHLAPFYENLSVSLEKYGLYGYAALSRITSARAYASAASTAVLNNTSASKAALERAADNLVAAGRIVALQGHEAESIGLLERALRLAPWRHEVRATLLEAQINQGDKLAAGRVAYLAYREDDPEAQLLLAKLYVRDKRVGDAAGCLRHAAIKKPDSYGIQLGLAEYLIGQKLPREALGHAQKAWGLASNLRERTRAAEAVTQAGGEAPAASDLRWEEYLRDYSTTALVAALYLLFLLHPGWTSLLRRLGGRLSHWQESWDPAD
ncbi:MAG: hypothetical protein ABFE16_17220 [Armatimonadia bacterium]